MTDNHFIFLLLGKTGNGKSATGNSILGSYAFKSGDSNDSLTTGISLRSAARKGYYVTVLDTPGFMDTHVDENKAKSKGCADMRKVMAQCPTDGKLALVIVLKYGERDTPDNKRSLHMLKQIFGEENLRKSCIIVMTHGELYNLKFKGKKCFKEWMEERTGELGNFLKMCGYKCVLFCNEEDGLKDEQFQTLIKFVKELDQSYTLTKFQSEKKQQLRLDLDAELPQLKEYYDKEIEKMQNELKKIGDGPQTIEALDEIDAAAAQLFKKVNEKDSPQVVFYQGGERRLLEKTCNSLNDIKEIIVKKKYTVHQMIIAEGLKNRIASIQTKIKSVNSNEIEIKSILSVIKSDIERLDLTKLDGKMRTEMVAAVDSTSKKLNKLENRVTLFLNLEHDIQILTDKYNALGTPCQVKRFKPLHDECDKLFDDVKTGIVNPKDREVLAKRLTVIKNAISEKKTENDELIVTLSLMFVPFAQWASVALTATHKDPPVVHHNKQKELEEAAKK